MENLAEYIERNRQNKEKAQDFSEYLAWLMEKYGVEKPSDLYTKANISKQTWSNIINKKSTPSLSSCIKIVFALGLDNRECKYLLKKAGFTLASSSTFALIVRYCVENKLDVWTLYGYLEQYGLEDEFKE